MSVLQTSMLAILKENRGHFTAGQILTLLRKTFPTASLATVYRNLDIFTREGKIRRVALADSPKYYEMNLAPHGHAVCLHCGQVVDLMAPEELSGLIAGSLQGKLLSTDLTVHYICKRCLKKMGGEQH
ncbi:MAG: transcriptional repressor [Christensenellaceae bacterium]|jgi:Fe2+ or Zn2+ uptake regulation protein|nr:transcriptional repressor [Christensenellaceae bacterium]